MNRTSNGPFFPFWDWKGNKHATTTFDTWLNQTNLINTLHVTCLHVQVSINRGLRVSVHTSPYVIVEAAVCGSRVNVAKVLQNDFVVGTAGPQLEGRGGDSLKAAGIVDRGRGSRSYGHDSGDDC